MSASVLPKGHAHQDTAVKELRGWCLQQNEPVESHSSVFERDVCREDCFFPLGVWK